MDNAATIIVFSIIALLFIMTVIKLIKDKKKGKSSCSCNCSSCTMNCPSKTQNK